MEHPLPTVAGRCVGTIAHADHHVATVERSRTNPTSTRVRFSGTAITFWMGAGDDLGRDSVSSKAGSLVTFRSDAGACLFDQMRTQPQFLANWILMLATLGHSWKNYTRWFLGSLWFWAGLHKAISPEWNAQHAFGMATRIGLDPVVWFTTVGITVAAAEIIAGLLAWWKPRLGAIGCVIAACRHFDPPLVHHRLELQRIAVEPGNCNHRVLGPLDLRPAFNGSPASCLLRFHHFARRILCRMDGSWILTRVVFWNGS